MKSYLGSDLVATLACLDVDDLPHGFGFDLSARLPGCEWLAELGPMFFSIKESYESALKRRQRERADAAKMEEEMEKKEKEEEEQKERERKESEARGSTSQRRSAMATPGRSANSTPKFMRKKGRLGF